MELSVPPVAPGAKGGVPEGQGPPPMPCVDREG